MSSRSDRQNNAEGVLTPQTDPWGQAMERATSQLLAQYRPIGSGVDGDDPFGGSVGGVTTNVANEVPIVPSGDYYGDAPSTLQPQVVVPNPWLRP